MEDWDGWRVPVHFGDAGEEAEAVRTTVGLMDSSSSRKWEIKGVDIAVSMSSSKEAAPRPGHLLGLDPGWLCRISYKHALLVSEQEEPSILAQIQAEFADEGCSHLLDRTDGLAQLRLSGPRSASVVSKLGAFDLREAAFPDCRCASGPLAGIQALLARRDQYGLPGYEVFISSEYGAYLWDAIVDGGKEFEMRPYGLEAKRLLEG